MDETPATETPKTPKRKASRQDQQPSLWTADRVRLIKCHSDGSLTPEFWDVEKLQSGVSGYKCNVVNVTWSHRTTCWEVKKTVDGKRKHIGLASLAQHGTVEAAFAAACAMRRGVIDGQAIRGEVVVQENGAVVVTRCSHNGCPCGTNLPLAAFAPDPSRAKHQFEEFALNTRLISDESASEAERAEALAFFKTPQNRTAHCFNCRTTAVRSKHSGANSETVECEVAAAMIRMVIRMEGCAVCGYKGCAMQNDHPDRVDKIGGGVGHAPTWVGNGGAKRQWANFLPTVPLCIFHHFLEPTHSIHNGANSTTMPIATEKQRRNKIKREYSEGKQRINNEWKRAVGGCVYCGCECVEGNEHAFQWMHKLEKMEATTRRLGLARPRRKEYEIGDLTRSTICLATFVTLARREIDECCELGCANCHHEYETLPEKDAQQGRLKAFVDEWLERGGVRVVELPADAPPPSVLHAPAAAAPTPMPAPAQAYVPAPALSPASIDEEAPALQAQAPQAPAVQKRRPSCSLCGEVGHYQPKCPRRLAAAEAARARAEAAVARARAA